MPEQERRVGILMGGIAASLAVAAALHLGGLVHGRGEPFDERHAGIAEAILCAVLAAGAVTVIRQRPTARAVGIAATGIAIAGFLNGLNMTARGGDLPDIAYHLVTLPLLGLGLVALWRQPRAFDGPAHGQRRSQN